MMSSYVSVFKIDGVPILPPVMTDSKREEMRLYRELAIKVQRRNEHAKHKEDSVDTLIPEKPADPPQEVATEFDCDETATSETLPTDWIEAPVTAPPIADACMDLSPEEESRRQESFSELHSPKLIRSNSYTLDQPSPMLLKFLDSIGDDPAVAKRRFSKNASNTAKSPSPGNRKKTPRKLSDPAKLRSIYGIQKSPTRRAKAESLDDTKRRLTIHSKGEKVEKFFMKSKTVKEFENLTKAPKSTEVRESLEKIEDHIVEVPSDDNKENEEEILLNATEEEETKLNLDQHKRALEQLNTHKLLLHKIEGMNLMDRTSTPVPKLFYPEADAQCDEIDPRLNDTSFYSTIRGESPVACSMSLVSDAYSKQYLNSIRSFTASPTPQETMRLQQENEEIAATIINSHVRGYLIRRLLRTEHVQDIIDNIKNILFLILDANPNEIQLKRSYLMKLNAYCESLHDVFFQFSTKERMQVIHKDRELLLARLSQRRTKLSSVRN